MKKFIPMLLFCAGVVACTTNPDGSRLEASDESTLEYYNRSMFNFNYHLQKKVLNPVARGYRNITNQSVRDRVTRFFDNLDEPAYAANHLLQGNLKDTGTAVGRFALNSTLGLGGLFDVAQGFGLERRKNSFDATLAKYCVPDGPFFVLPIVGPATPRYIVGWGADGLASPMYWALLDVDNQTVDTVVYGAVGIKYINYYAENMYILDALEAGSVDFYETIKSTFLQNRQKFSSLCADTDDTTKTPSYDFDFDDDDED